MPEVDWSKVKVDTPILVREYESGNWNKRYFAKFAHGTVYAWSGGATSWSADGEHDVSHWNYAKLVEGTAYEFGIKLLDYLNNKDADYDIDRVIKELSEWTVNTDIKITDGEVVNRDVIVGCTAIDIVKEGGTQTSMYDNPNISTAPRLE